MAANHGVKKYSPQFSYDYAKSVFENNISAEFLKMTMNGKTMDKIEVSVKDGNFKYNYTLKEN